jgi:hypothetical protein
MINGKPQHAVVSGEYITFKHVKTRKMVILEIEVPEEQFQHVINTLGMPIGGESKHVAVALLTDQPVKPQTLENGDKMRTKAVLLCQDQLFQEYCHKVLGATWSEFGAKLAVYDCCAITSRSELATNADALHRFATMVDHYNTWKTSQLYKDNLERA